MEYATSQDHWELAMAIIAIVFFIVLFALGSIGVFGLYVQEWFHSYIPPYL